MKVPQVQHESEHQLIPSRDVGDHILGATEVHTLAISAEIVGRCIRKPSPVGLLKVFQTLLEARNRYTVGQQLFRYAEGNEIPEREQPSSPTPRRAEN